MEFEIIYSEDVVDIDIPLIDRSNRHTLRQAIEKKLVSNPTLYGKPLRGSLKNYYKLRVGDYRIIFRIEKRFVKIFAIMHRKIVYKKFEKRIG